ncbi:MAG: hypothetical protein ACRECX_07915 [Methyloceanibacter sp.]
MMHAQDADGVVLALKPLNETVIAKQPAPVEAPARGAAVTPDPAETPAEPQKSSELPADTVIAGLPPLPRPEPRVLQPGEWAEVVGYTAISRARPASSSYVLAGYPVGQPFRVLAREGEFVRVQDLRSGQLGWIKQSSLAPYTGYARRYAPPPPTYVAMAPAISLQPEFETEAEAVEPQAVAAMAAVAEEPQGLRDQRRPYTLGPVAEAEPAASAIEAKPGRVWRVAVQPKGDGFPALMQRAFSGY